MRLSLGKYVNKDLGARIEEICSHLNSDKAEIVDLHHDIVDIKGQLTALAKRETGDLVIRSLILE